MQFSPMSEIGDAARAFRFALMNVLGSVNGSN
jgi:hypothetical protein